MKLVKTIFVYLLITVFIVSFSGCSKSGKSTNLSTGTTTTAAPPPASGCNASCAPACCEETPPDLTPPPFTGGYYTPPEVKTTSHHHDSSKGKGNWDQNEENWALGLGIGGAVVMTGVGIGIGYAIGKSKGKKAGKKLADDADAKAKAAAEAQALAEANAKAANEAKEAAEEKAKQFEKDANCFKKFQELLLADKTPEAIEAELNGMDCTVDLGKFVSDCDEQVAAVQADLDAVKSIVDSFLNAVCSDINASFNALKGKKVKDCSGATYTINRDNFGKYYAYSKIPDTWQEIQLFFETYVKQAYGQDIVFDEAKMINQCMDSSAAYSNLGGASQTAE